MSYTILILKGVKGPWSIVYPSILRNKKINSVLYWNPHGNSF